MKIGIDIGTVHSKVCFKDNTGKMVQINTLPSSELGMHSYLLPSVVGAIDNELIVGFDALEKAGDMDIFINDLRRDINKKVPYAVNNSKFTVEDGYEALFSYLRNCAERAIDMQIDNACITHPAIFDDENRKLLAKAATRAGVLSIDLIAEPIAAVISYCNKERFDNDGTFLVYDLGGGTFDATIITKKNGKYRQVSEVGHIEQCGGRIFDKLLSQLIITKLTASVSKLPDAQMQKLKTEVSKLSTKVKHQLSSQKEATHKLLVNGNWITFSIQREEFNGAIVKLVDNTLNCVKDLLHKANVTTDKIDTVLAIGGSCNIPFVKERLQKIWGNKVNIVTNTHIIAEGAMLSNINTGGQQEDKSTDDQATKCANCGSSSRGKHYCRKCGNVIQYPDYIVDDDMKKAYQENVQNIVNGINSIEQVKLSDLAKASVGRYASIINKAIHITKSNSFNDLIGKDTLKLMDDYLHLCASGEFHIAIIGTIKAGKSTLINAMLERELASTNIVPETAALTKFRRSEKNDYIKIHFYNKKEGKELWDNVENSRAEVFKYKYKELNASFIEKEWIAHPEIFTEFEDEASLKKAIALWTSAQSPNHYFVKEIEIGLKDLNISKEIVFVDTPGLDDPIKNRSDVTRKYMSRANLVVVCVKVDKLTGYEIDTILNVFTNLRYNPGKVFILATQIDNLRNIEEDWNEIKHEWMQHLSGQNCFNNRDLAERNLIPVAAYMDTLLAKFADEGKLNKNEEKTLRAKLDWIVDEREIEALKKPEVMSKMRAFANMELIRGRLMNEELGNAQKMVYDDLIVKYKILKAQLSSPLIKIKKSQNDIIESLNSGVDEIKRKVAEAKIELEANEQKKKELADDMKTFTNALNNATDKLVLEIKKMYNY